MNGFGLEFYTLKRIKKDKGLSDEEMRRRNLALSRLEKDILMDVPVDGPPKHADKVKATNWHHRTNRNVPASLILTAQDSDGFDEWMGHLRKGPAGRYQATMAYFVSLKI